MGSYKKIGLSHERGLIDTPSFELVSVALTSYLNLLLKNSNNFLSDL